MFKCSECGCEFEQKPDFCDCGNDIFVEIADVKKEVENKPQPKRKKTFEEQYPELSTHLSYLDPISVGIFLVCIMLSIVSFIIIKPYAKVEQEQKVVAQKVTHNVADINSFWNDTPPKAKINSDVPKEINIAEQIKTVIAQNVQPQKTVQNNVTVKSKPVAKSVKQTVIQPKKTVSQPSQTVKTKTIQNAKPVQKVATTKTQPVKQQTPQQPTVWQPSTQTPPQVHQPSNARTPVQTVTTTVNQSAQELKNYKDGLRNTIGKKIDFTRVYGNGSCVVQFKVDSTGRLINRKFTTQSTNNTLNDEVFNAMKMVPVYKAPPSSYNGETMSMKVNFNNGHYSVSLK